MERTYKLDLQSINDAKDFVVAINKLNSEVDARYGVRVVDAKSIKYVSLQAVRSNYLF